MGVSVINPLFLPGPQFAQLYSKQQSGPYPKRRKCETQSCLSRRKKGRMVVSVCDSLIGPGFWVQEGRESRACYLSHPGFRKWEGVLLEGACLRHNEKGSWLSASQTLVILPTQWSFSQPSNRSFLAKYYIFCTSGGF